MEESSTYQAIIEKGEVLGERKQAHKTLLLLGERRFGKPTATLRKAIESIDDLQRLEQLSVRLLDVNSWHELLELPAPRKRKKS